MSKLISAELTHPVLIMEALTHSFSFSISGRVVTSCKNYYKIINKENVKLYEINQVSLFFLVISIRTIFSYHLHLRCHVSYLRDRKESRSVLRAEVSPL